MFKAKLNSAQCAGFARYLNDKALNHREEKSACSENTNRLVSEAALFKKGRDTYPENKSCGIDKTYNLKKKKLFSRNILVDKYDY